MVASCVICLGSSGQALAGKRCRASRCKAEYAARIKLAKAAAGGVSSTATSPTASAGAARSSAELESLVALKLWEMFGIYGRREYDPDTLTSYERFATASLPTGRRSSRTSSTLRGRRTRTTSAAQPSRG